MSNISYSTDYEEFWHIRCSLYHSANLHILADDRYINADTNVYNKMFELIYLGLLKLATIMVFLFGLLCTNNGHRFYNKTIMSKKSLHMLNFYFVCICCPLE